MRASQINGCAYCIDMHSKDARAAGETEQRLYLLDAWRETAFYTDRERAALAWTEAVTMMTERTPPTRSTRRRASISPTELVDLTLAIAAINAWNRLAISFRTVPGRYKASLIRRQLAEQRREPAGIRPVVGHAMELDRHAAQRSTESARAPTRRRAPEARTAVVDIQHRDGDGPIWSSAGCSGTGGGAARSSCPPQGRRRC